MIILACKEILPESDAPYTLHEITLRCRNLEPSMTYGRVHHALSTLRDDPERAADVEPLRSRPGARQLRFGHIAAQRIARQALPKRLLRILRTPSKLNPN